MAVEKRHFKAQSCTLGYMVILRFQHHLSHIRLWREPYALVTI